MIRLVNNGLVAMCKEAVATWFKIPCRHISGGTERNNKGRVAVQAHLKVIPKYWPGKSDDTTTNRDMSKAPPASVFFCVVQTWQHCFGLCRQSLGIHSFRSVWIASHKMLAEKPEYLTGREPCTNPPQMQVLVIASFNDALRC